MIIVGICAGLLVSCHSSLFSRDRLGSIIHHDRNSGHLTDGHRRYRFIGVNVYSLASHPDGVGYSCGRSWNDAQLDQLFREVAEMGGNAIRLSAYQSFTASGSDYSRFDLIVRLAHRYGLRLIMTLENQWRHCTEGGYKYSDWYRDGYRRTYGRYRLSYLEHVRRTVSRYRDDSAILMWQLMNEAESVSRAGIEDPIPLADFTARMANEVRRIDRRHLLCLGTSGIDRPGSGGLWYVMLAATPGIDIVEAHDYDSPNDPWPSDVRRSSETARRIGQPFFIGEVGIPSPPYAKAKRAELTMAKVKAAWSQQVAGVLIWSYRAGDGTGRDFDPSDPLYAALKKFAASALKGDD